MLYSAGSSGSARSSNTEGRAFVSCAARFHGNNVIVYRTLLQMKTSPTEIYSFCGGINLGRLSLHPWRILPVKNMQNRNPPHRPPPTDTLPTESTPASG